MTSDDLGTTEQFRECMDLLPAEVRPDPRSTDPMFDDMLAVIGAAAMEEVYVKGYGTWWLIDDIGSITPEIYYPTPLAAVAAGLRAKKEAGDD